MKKRQHNKLTMYLTTQQILTDNSAIVSTIPALPSIINNFSGNIAAIHTAARRQQTITTGIATDKKIFKHTLVESASVIEGALTAIASKANNNELLEQVAYSRTKLFKTRDELICQRCKTILDRANDNLAAILATGITPLHLSNFQTHINNYYSKTPLTANARITRQTVTALISRLFTQTDELLKIQLDGVILQFKTTHNEFYNAYKAARKIVHHGIHHTSLRIKITDTKGNPLSGVMVSLIQNNKTIYSHITSAEPKTSISKITPGTYDLKIEKPNSTSRIESAIHFAAGKRIRRSITLS